MLGKAHSINIKFVRQNERREPIPIAGLTLGESALHIIVIK